MTRALAILSLAALTACASHEAALTIAPITPPVTPDEPDAGGASWVEQSVTVYGHGFEKTKLPPDCLECTSVEGSLVPEVILRIIHLNRARFRFCYANALRLAPDLSGRIAIRFVISRSGAVSKSIVEPSSTITDEGFRACLVGAFTKLDFPQPEGGEVVVSYPMIFTPRRR